MQDSIKYKQWVTEDGTEMMTVIKPRDEYFEILIESLDNVKKHHFVTKSQARFLNDKNFFGEQCIYSLSDFS